MGGKQAKSEFGEWVACVPSYFPFDFRFQITDLLNLESEICNLSLVGGKQPKSEFGR